MLTKSSKKTGFRIALGSASAFMVLLGAFGATASMLRVGQNIKQSSDFSNSIEEQKSRQLAEVDREREVVKARDKAGIGNKSQSLILVNVNSYDPKKFFHQAWNTQLGNFAKTETLTLLSNNNKVIGTYYRETNTICNRENVCIPFNTFSQD